MSPLGPGPDAGARQPGRSLGSGLLVGVGVAAFLDETVFHQLLHWHHFYDRSSTSAALVSDGLFHAFGWLAVVTGLFLFADLQRRSGTVAYRVWAGGLLGCGVFQLYDGLVQHKLLRLHQVRYDVHLLPYDIAWNVPGLVLALAGAVLLARARRA